MNKEELIELRNRVSVLDDAEKDRVLAEINNGKEYDFNTGYATIDRPWQNYFRMENFYDIKNDMTVYQDIVKNNMDYLDNLALLSS